MRVEGALEYSLELDLVVVLYTRWRPLAAGNVRSGVGRKVLGKNRCLEPALRKKDGRGQSHHPSAKHGNFFTRSVSLVGDDLGHLMGAAPAHRYSGPCVPVIVHDQAAVICFRFQPVRAITLWTKACLGWMGIWIPGEVGTGKKICHGPPPDQFVRSVIRPIGPINLPDKSPANRRIAVQPWASSHPHFSR